MIHKEIRETLADIELIPTTREVPGGLLVPGKRTMSQPILTRKEAHTGMMQDRRPSLADWSLRLETRAMLGTENSSGPKCCHPNQSGPGREVPSPQVILIIGQDLPCPGNLSMPQPRETLICGRGNRQKIMISETDHHTMLKCAGMSLLRR